MATNTTQRAQVVPIIVEAADRNQIPRKVALAFAWCESRFNPLAAGDRDWSVRDGGRRYEAHVLNAFRLRANPARNEKEAWHSYGLFQLLACYHVLDHEHPRALYDPRVNAERACAHIRHLLHRTGGDPEAARLLYVGLPLIGADEKRALVLANFRAALKRFEHVAELDDKKEPTP